MARTSTPTRRPSSRRAQRVGGLLKEQGSTTRCASWSAATSPAEDLIGVAEEEAADFIVIGLRRRSPVGKLILGSNAQRILLDASCPVLAVKAELTGPRRPIGHRWQAPACTELARPRTSAGRARGRPVRGHASGVL